MTQLMAYQADSAVSVETSVQVNKTFHCLFKPKKHRCFFFFLKEFILVVIVVKVVKLSFVDQFNVIVLKIINAQMKVYI
jgi:hypothetical protein